MPRKQKLPLANLREQAKTSRESLKKIGDGDWTPQDGVHLALLHEVEKIINHADGENNPLPWRCRWFGHDNVILSHDPRPREYTASGKVKLRKALAECRRCGAVTE